MISTGLVGEIPVTGHGVVRDAELFDRSLTDPHAFGAVFDRHFVAVHRYVHRRAGRDIADDVAAETFKVAFEKRATWSGGGRSARPWLLGIATHLLQRHRRSEERRLRALARGASDVWATFDEVASATRLDALDRHAALAAALAGLTRPDRDVVALVALAELSYDEAASALGISPGTVASRLHRARRRLAESLLREEGRP